MRRRPAVTLLEVLIALFIMAIGMLALLVLFPLGAWSMGKALKDDRCASAAAMAEQCAIASNLRHDSTVETYLTLGLPTSYTGPSLPVYVDPYGVQGGVTILGTGPSIQRVTPSYALAPALVDRWFSLPNDIGFLTTGTPDLSAGSVERGRAYTWAYMVRRTQTWSDKAVDLTVVAYHNRPTAVATAETVYQVSQNQYAAPKGLFGTSPTSGPTQGASGLVLTNASASSFRRGMWLLDISYIGSGTANATTIPRSDFYRIVNVDDIGGNQVAVDVQPNLICDNNPNATVTTVILMDNAAEVFHKGTSWLP